MRQSRRHLLIAILAQAAGLAIPGVRAGSPDGWTLESVRGDRIRIEFLAGRSDDGDRITVCLTDAAGGCPKAFDIRPDARPRFVTSGATPVCTQVAAEVQSLFLWEMRTAGPVNVVNATIALDAHRGRNMRITWLETGNPAGCTAR